MSSSSALSTRIPTVLRRLPPAYSPVRFSSLLRGLTGLVSSARAARDGAWLERTVTDYFAARRVILTDSGTTALMLALRLAKRRSPDAPAALPAFGCYDLATAARGARARVFLYDVEPAALAPSPDSLDTILRRKPAALVVAGLYGIPIDTTSLREICDAEGILLIEDVAQGFGATIGGGPVGTSGSLAVLSFGRGKGITGGRGGALIAVDRQGHDLLTQTDGLEVCRSAPGGLVALGAQWLLGRPQFYGIPTRLPGLHLGEAIYRQPHEPRSLGPPGPSVLRTTWAASLEEVERRQERAAILRAVVESLPGCQNVQPPPQSEPSYLRLPFIISRPVSPAVATRGMDLGILPSYPKALCDLDGFSDSVENRTASFDGARYLASHLWTAPVHKLVTQRDIERMEVWFGSLLRE